MQSVQSTMRIEAFNVVNFVPFIIELLRIDISPVNAAFSAVELFNVQQVGFVLGQFFEGTANYCASLQDWLSLC